MVTAHAGVGIWAQVDHSKPDQVKALFERVEKEQEGRLDILVNDMTGDRYVDWEKRLWNHSLEKALLALKNGVHSHIITSYYGAQLMVKRCQGLIVEVNDGNGLVYNGNFYYSFNKCSAVLMACFLSRELQEYNIATVAITPGYLRSEAMLEHFGVTEENWRDAIEQDPIFEDSETPYYVGRAVVALACDPKVMIKTGRALSSGWLAPDYGFTDVDGRQPPGYYPKEGVFTPRRGFELQAPGLSAAERLLREELKAIARELGVPGVDRMRNIELVEAIARIDPSRFEQG